jgi:hypothetical protein
LNAAQGIDDQVKSAIQDIVAPALHEIRGAMQANAPTSAASIPRSTMSTPVSATRSTRWRQMGHMKGELIAEIRRVDAQIDGVHLA